LAFVCWAVRSLLRDALAVFDGCNSRLVQQQRAAPTMNRDDALLWLSLFWFVALSGAAIWAFISL